MEDKILNTVSKQPTNHTESLNDLFAALAKAQSEMEVAGLNAANPFFKSRYCDLAGIVKVSRPCLAKNGLCVIQQILPDENLNTFLHTKLCHASGQWIESRIRIVPPKSDVQTLGSYITYLRRYSYAALIGVVSSDEDDDGEKAMNDRNESKPSGKITKEQLEVLEAEVESYEDIVQQIKTGLKIANLADMPQEKFESSLKRIRQIKHERSLHA